MTWSTLPRKRATPRRVREPLPGDGPPPANPGKSGAPAKRRNRKSGFPRAVRAVILARDGGCVVRQLPPRPPDWPTHAGTGAPEPHPHDVRCGGDVEAHHLWRKGQRGPDESWNGKTLCSDHHRWVHAYPRLARRLDLLRLRGERGPVDNATQPE